MLFILFFSLLLKDSVVAWESPTTHDFGDLILKESYYHSFTFKNISQDTIRIDNIRAGCGCTVPNWDKTTIPPGQKSEIRVEFRPRTAGYNRKQIKVFFSGQRQGEKLYVEAYVERE